MSKEPKQILDHRPLKTAGSQPVVAASPDHSRVTGGSQTDSQLAGAKVEHYSQGELPVIIVPGGTPTDSTVADERREDTNVGTYSQGESPVIIVPGGS